ncbi:MAG: thermonuclease family protein [Planctomycetes bacterium]|nr:thermonuclease family protein [Planctomycetota bacterium]
MRAAPIAVLLPLIAGCAGSDLVEEVRGGDVVVLGDGRVVRYAGVAAPAPGEPLFEEAREANRTLVLGRKVTLVLAREGENEAGEVLAFVYAPVEEAGKTRFLFVQGELALWGFVKVVRPPAASARPELDDDLARLSTVAQELGRGLWSPD